MPGGPPRSPASGGGPRGWGGGLRAGGALRASTESCKMESLAGAGRPRGQGTDSPPLASPSATGDTRAMPPPTNIAPQPTPPPPHPSLKAPAVLPGLGWGLAGLCGKWRMGRDKMESG